MAFARKVLFSSQKKRAVSNLFGRPLKVNLVVMGTTIHNWYPIDQKKNFQLALLQLPPELLPAIAAVAGR